MWIIKYVLFCHILGLSVVVATIVSFDGTQYMRIVMPELSQTEVEDMSIRFQTRRPNGLLFTTRSSGTSDRLELMLEGGRVRFDADLGAGARVSMHFMFPSYILET